MSVILKALKSNNEGNEKLPAKEDLTSGYFQEADSGKKTEEYKKIELHKEPVLGTVLESVPEKRKIKRIHILAGILILITAFFVTYHKFTSKKTHIVQNVVEIVSPQEAQNLDPSAQLAKNARDAYISGDLDASMNLYKQVADANPNSAQLHNNFGLDRKSVV